MASWSGSTYSFTQSLSAVDFYGTGEVDQISVSVSGSVTVSASITKTAFASASLSGSADVVPVAREILLASPAFDGDVATVAVGIRMRTSATFLDGSVDLTASATKFAYATANLSGDASLTASALEILGAESSISITSSMPVSATRIKLAGAALDSNLNLSAVGTRMPTIDIAVDGSASLSSSTLAFRVINVNIDGLDGSLSSTSTAIRLGSSTPSGSADLTASSLKFAYSSSNIECLSSTSITALEILLGAADLSGSLVSLVVGREVLLADISIQIVSDIILPGTTRFGPSVLEDVETIRTLISIDGKPLSEHNRKFSSSIIQSFIENRNWASARSRYYKSSNGRKTFSINWTMLPSLRDQTVDKRFGRDKVHEIATDPDVHTLKLLNFDSDGTTPYTETEYNVLVKSYSENLIRRDINNNMYLWDCAIELEEV